MSECGQGQSVLPFGDLGPILRGNSGLDSLDLGPASAATAAWGCQTHIGALLPTICKIRLILLIPVSYGRCEANIVTLLCQTEEVSTYRVFVLRLKL